MGPPSSSAAGHNGLVARRLPRARGRARARARGARPRRRRVHDRGDLARVQGLHRGVRREPLPPGDRPRPRARAARLRRAAARPVLVHAVPRRPLAAPRARTPRRNQREVAKFSDARRGSGCPTTRRMLERIARAIEPTLLETPPDPFSGRPRDLLRLARMGARFLRLGARRPRRARDPHRRGARRARPLVRVGRAEGDARDRRDHRRVGVAVHARHRLRALPPRDGRGGRRARRLGLRPRRDGRAPRGDRRRRRAAAARRSAPAPASRGSSSAAAPRRASSLEDGTELLARRVASSADATPTLLELVGARAPRRPDVADAGAAHRLRERLGEDQRRARRAARASARCPAAATAPGPAAPRDDPRRAVDGLPRARVRRRARRARPRARRCSSARSRPRSTRPSRPPGKHLMSMFVQYAPYRLAEGSWEDGAGALRRSLLRGARAYAPGFTARGRSRARCSRRPTSSAASASPAATSSRAR